MKTQSPRLDRAEAHLRELLQMRTEIHTAIDQTEDEIARLKRTPKTKPKAHTKETEIDQHNT